MKAIEFDKINFNIGEHKILDDVSFSVNKGTIFGLIGHNGAGKTSLLRILLGLTRGYHGDIRIMGSDRLNEQRAHIGAVMDSLTMDKSLNAAKYIHSVCYMLGVDSAEAERELLAKVGLEDAGKKPVSGFSLGMKRRLLIAGALAGSPAILVLDEPFNGIDPEGMAALRLVMQQLVAEGITVLVTSHNIPELIKLSDAFGIMHSGRFVQTITASELSVSYYDKMVLRTDNPQLLMKKLRESYPQLDCAANSPGEISVFGALSEDGCDELIYRIPEADITGFHRCRMSEEEILLWRMNGFTE